MISSSRRGGSVNSSMLQVLHLVARSFSLTYQLWRMWGIYFPSKSLTIFFVNAKYIFCVSVSTISVSLLVIESSYVTSPSVNSWRETEFLTLRKQCNFVLWLFMRRQLFMWSVSCLPIRNFWKVGITLKIYTIVALWDSISVRLRDMIRTVSLIAQIISAVLGRT